MDDQNRNLLLATVLSFVVIVIWFVLFPPPEPIEATDPVTAESTVDPDSPAAPAAGGDGLLPRESGETGAATPGGTGTDAAPDAAAAAPRVQIDTPSVSGSISLLGARLDDLKLKQYRTDLSPDAPEVTLLKPAAAENAYFALFGWVPGQGAAQDVPGADTLWSGPEDATLTPDSPVTLEWDNGAGLIFRRTISIDEHYMFSVAQTVENTTDQPVTLRPYGLVRRHGLPGDMKNFFILHEGLVRMSDGELQEESYDNIQDFDRDEREGVPAERTEVVENGWVGFTDHFWMTTLIPEGAFRSTAKYFPERDIYQTEAVLPPLEVAAGATAATETRLFAGAKEWETIRNYEAGRTIDSFGESLAYGMGFSEANGVPGFLDSIDWGWFFFLTKPIFFVLHELHAVIGNMGWSIIALTIVLKIILFPLAYKSYASMAKMKELQPEMEKLKERAGDDRQKLQKEMMELYRREKVNPAAGCLPILLQIPIFFSLYKVIFVTLELRHAPWVGWIRDLSAPDPSSILNLFGLLPFAAPDPTSFLAIISLGILPILLGISMWLQQKLNPAPTDPTQAMIFAWMPWVFMFMLGTFASGLVLYWITNNTITFIQQYAIMRSHGYKPDVFGNIRRSFSRKKAAGDKS